MGWRAQKEQIHLAVGDIASWSQSCHIEMDHHRPERPQRASMVSFNSALHQKIKIVMERVSWPPQSSLIVSIS